VAERDTFLCLFVPHASKLKGFSYLSLEDMVRVLYRRMEVTSGQESLLEKEMTEG
jgi:hypothetical protein